MTNRKKRLEKGIESIQKQIEEHKLKRERVLEEGKLELADYYETEITGLEKSQEKKKRMVEE